MSLRCFGGRVLKPEILDTLPFDQARGSLADLVRINRRWGGHSTLRKLLADVVGNTPFALLDVGAASGDMGNSVRAWYPQSTVTSLDRLESHLVNCTGQRVAGDAFGLPFRPRSFDYVFCSLFLHHFTNVEIVKLLRGFGEVARRAVLIIDLERHPVAYYFLPMTRWLFRWDPVTVNDGAISVEAAFKVGELDALCHEAGLTPGFARVYRPAFRIAIAAAVSGYNSEWEDNEQRR